MPKRYPVPVSITPNSPPPSKKKKNKKKILMAFKFLNGQRKPEPVYFLMWKFCDIQIESVATFALEGRGANSLEKGLCGLRGLKCLRSGLLQKSVWALCSPLERSGGGNFRQITCPLPTVRPNTYGLRLCARHRSLGVSFHTKHRKAGAVLSVTSLILQVRKWGCRRAITRARFSQPASGKSEILTPAVPLQSLWQKEKGERERKRERKKKEGRRKEKKKEDPRLQTR